MLNKLNIRCILKICKKCFPFELCVERIIHIKLKKLKFDIYKSNNSDYLYAIDYNCTK